MDEPQKRIHIPGSNPQIKITILFTVKYSLQSFFGENKNKGYNFPGKCKAEEQKSTFFEFDTDTPAIVATCHKI